MAQSENNNPHSGLYVVVQKGEARCMAGSTPCGFKVNSHSLQHANGDTADHLIVTEDDTTFASPSAPFGHCSVINNTCNYVPAGKWQDTYSKIKILGKSILTEKSILICKGTPIKVYKHGQSQQVVNAHFDNVDLEELQMVSPLASELQPGKDMPQVKNIEVKFPGRTGTAATQKNTLTKANKNAAIPVITARKDEDMEFKVSSYYNANKADKTKVSWMIYQGNGYSSEKLSLKEYGEELKFNFDEYGEYTVHAYGNSPKDNRCSFVVQVKQNELKEIKPVGVNVLDKLIRRGALITFHSEFLFPPSVEEAARLNMSVRDASGSVASNSVFTPPNILTFTPQNTGTYTVYAEYTREDGTVQSINKPYKSINNSVNKITATPSADKYRPGTTITFEVSQMKFSFLADNDDTWDRGEYSRIKWNINNQQEATGRRFTKTFTTEGTYVVESYVAVANANTKNEDDDWRFTITKNKITGYKGGNLKTMLVGKNEEIEVETLISPYNAALDGPISWEATAGLRIVSSSGTKAVISASQITVGGITAKLNGKSTTLLVTASEAPIKRWCFTDSNGLYKRYAGWGETMNVLIESTPLVAGEKIKLHLMEYDSPTDANYIKDLGEVTFDEKGIAQTSFKTDDIKPELEKLWLENDNYELFFVVEKRVAGIQFAEAKEKTRGGKLSYYPTKTSEASKGEIGKFLFIDNKKDIVEVRYYDVLGNRLWKVLKYGESVKVHIQTRNMAGTKIKWQIYQNVVTGNDKKVGPEQEFTINENETLRLDIDTNILKNSIAESERRKIAMFYCVITEADGDTFKYPKDLAISQTLDTKKINFYHHLKLSEAPEYINELAKNNAPLIVGEPLESDNDNCGQRYCIKRGDRNELIREINIRLAGFGGNVPTDEFTDRTEKMIKQFQRDYMKVPETGRICGNVLKAIDDFSSKYDISSTIWAQLKCSCSTKGQQTTSSLRGIRELNRCDGYGDGTGNNTEPERSNRYEYPGIHRSLLFGLKALFFYLKQQNVYQFGLISSGYRCRFKNYRTTNHQGKAIDIQFNKGTWEIRGQVYRNIAPLIDIREKFFYKYFNAKTNWTTKNHFGLEPIGLNSNNTKIDGNHTYSWIHMDVREFDKIYLDRSYFCKNSSDLNGRSIVSLAREQGFVNTCNCMGGAQTGNNINENEGRVNPRTLRTSDKGKDFIKAWEDFSSRPYNDSEGFATIGYGYLIARKSHLNVTQADVARTDITWAEFTNGITRERALELFEQKVTTFERAIQRDITVNLYQQEFDALVSLLYNTGENFLNTGGVRGGETKIKRNINDMKYSEGADEFSDVTNGGQGGLVTRRQREIDIFKNNIYNSAH